MGYRLCCPPTSSRTWSGSADYLVLLSRGHIQVVGEVEDLLAHHRVLTGPVSEYERYSKNWNVVHASQDASRVHVRVRCDGTSDPVPPGWEARPITLEELNIAYLREPDAAALPGPSRAAIERSELAK